MSQSEHELNKKHVREDSNMSGFSPRNTAPVIMVKLANANPLDLGYCSVDSCDKNVVMYFGYFASF